VANLTGKRVLVLGDGQLADAVAAALGDAGATIETSAAATAADGAAAVEAAAEALGGLDGLVTLPTPLVLGSIQEGTQEGWSSAIEGDLLRVYAACRAAARVQMKQRSGRIVNVSRASGLIGGHLAAGSAAAAGALTGFTKTLARELAGRGAQANLVAMGPIEGDELDLLPEADRAAALEQIPLGRAGKPEEVGAIVAFLLSDDASYITGQTITLDGGWVMR